MNRDDMAAAETRVAAAPEHAFEVFAEDLASWWPPEYTWSQRGLEWIGIDPREGGLCTELGPGGFRVDWGRVLIWHPPERLAFTWQISASRVPEPDPARSSLVDVHFEAAAGATRVRVVHAGFARHGEGADEYRAAMRDQGWPYILERYAAAFG
jgi:uncharacterized protein YndB with AHSA1/START domain